MYRNQGGNKKNPLKNKSRVPHFEKKKGFNDFPLFPELKEVFFFFFVGLSFTIQTHFIPDCLNNVQNFTLMETYAGCFILLFVIFYINTYLTKKTQNKKETENQAILMAVVERNLIKID